MKTVAFLQNQWFRNPARAQALFDRWIAAGHDRHELVARYLFAGCLTGRRLRKAFGDDLCDLIVWEEVSTQFGGHASSVFPPDPAHIRAVLAKQQPYVVLCFGRVAADGLAGLWSGPLIRVPHPAARHKTVISELNAAAEQLRFQLQGEP